jgi:hypothetical protein
MIIPCLPCNLYFTRQRYRDFIATINTSSKENAESSATNTLSVKSQAQNSTIGVRGISHEGHGGAEANEVLLTSGAIDVSTASWSEAPHSYMRPKRT